MAQAMGSPMPLGMTQPMIMRTTKPMTMRQRLRIRPFLISCSAGTPVMTWTHSAAYLTSPATWTVCLLCRSWRCRWPLAPLFFLSRRVWLWRVGMRCLKHEARLRFVESLSLVQCCLPRLRAGGCVFF